VFGSRAQRAKLVEDRRFQPGEAVSSRQIAKILSSSFDWMVTVDPYLHRYSSLGEVYTIPTRVIHAALLISEWIRNNVERPLIIGPDSESEQWAAAVAKDARASYSVLEKVRRGDRDVEIKLKDLDTSRGCRPVLVDNINSSGRTMIAAVQLLIDRGWQAPICIAVHSLFAHNSDQLLAQLGARVVTSNTVPHATNAIDVGDLLAEAVDALVV
jgi:ribose-phosphate pyrophosphokinase